jgi:hypothetical protein
MNRTLCACLNLILTGSVMLLGASPAGATDAQLVQAAATKCESLQTNAQPGRFMLELFVMSGSQIDQVSRDKYRSLAADAIAWACATGAKLEIRPIDSQSFEEPIAYSSPPFPQERSQNPYVDHDKRAQFIADALDTVEKMYQTKGTPRADFFGAIRRAAKETGSVASAMKVTVVLVGHGWQQVPDFFQADKDPATFTADYLTKLRTLSEIPDLHGTRVVFVGVSSGPKGMQQAKYLESLCSNFWKPLIQASKGTWGDCWPQLPPDLRQ